MQTLASMKPSAIPGAIPAAPPRPQPTLKPAAIRQQRSTNADANANWRVIAFTYNESSQAQAKADRLGQRNPNLHFEVFAPHGHPPYLVTVNGFMTREEAMALRDRLRGNGLPFDIYAQNYATKGR